MRDLAEGDAAIVGIPGKIPKNLRRAREGGENLWCVMRLLCKTYMRAYLRRTTRGSGSWK